MKLADKGRFQTRPTLPHYAEQLAEELASWPGVRARTHWLLGDQTVVDGADFYVGEEELGHLHLDGTAHIPQSNTVAKALIAAHLALPFRWSASWVVALVEDEGSAQHASWLFQLNYDKLRGAEGEALLQRVRRVRSPMLGRPSRAGKV